MKMMEVLFTKADYERLPEGYPAQLVDGQLCRDPAPRYGHQRVSSSIRFALVSLVGPARVSDSPVDVLLDEINVYQPDVVVLREPVFP